MDNTDHVRTHVTQQQRMYAGPGKYVRIYAAASATGQTATVHVLYAYYDYESERAWPPSTQRRTETASRYMDQDHA